MIERLKIVLPQEEFTALQKLARRELRCPEHQMRILAREELVRRGLLDPSAMETGESCKAAAESGR